MKIKHSADLYGGRAGINLDGTIIVHTVVGTCAAVGDETERNLMEEAHIYPDDLKPGNFRAVSGAIITLTKEDCIIITNLLGQFKADGGKVLKKASFAQEEPNFFLETARKRP